MASPTFTWTARFVAEQLGVEEDFIEEIASMAMEPEDGRISIIDSNEDVSIRRVPPCQVRDWDRGRPYSRT